MNRLGLIYLDRKLLRKAHYLTQRQAVSVNETIIEEVRIPVFYRWLDLSRPARIGLLLIKEEE